MLLLSIACRHWAGAPSPTPQTQAQSGAGTASRANGAPEIGFATRQKFLDHYDKHALEFGSVSKEEYLRQAQTLRDRPAGGDVLEVRRADGVITRFDRQTGAFLAFNSDLTIRTYFKPNDGENYFRRQGKRPVRGAESQPEKEQDDE